MSRGCVYGSHRVMEPKGGLPQPAWKLDPRLPILDNEILIDVQTLNVNSASFAQLMMECGPDPERIGAKIESIVNLRGKLHNPVTGTGGMLLGTVRSVGPAHPARSALKPGDCIATLVSLTLTPLAIERILGVRIESGQVDVVGHAILFESTVFARVPADLPRWLLLAALDEAGAPKRVHDLAFPGAGVLIVGASGKLGAMCMFAARDRIGPDGRLVALVNTEKGFSAVSRLCVADQVVVADATNTTAALATLRQTVGSWMPDLTADCVNVPGTEMLSVLASKQGAHVYYAGLATRYTVAALGAEGAGLDIEIHPYKGYTRGHADYAIDLLRRYPALAEYLTARLLSKASSTSRRRLDASAPVTGRELERDAVPEVSPAEIIMKSPQMLELYRNALRIARYDTTVLITGESGVGKELFAQVVHRSSTRSDGSLIRINCAAIPENLLEAELFGYERGAFTGANRQGKMGIFEAAHGGTLFLDEIGDMPLPLQAKLLRAVQEKEIMRIGGTRPVRIDVRLIAATNRDLKDLVEKKLFREDLYYRLNVARLHVPPLRERRMDIPYLVEFFVGKYNEVFKTDRSFSTEALDVLYKHDWPGNVRELENLVQRLMLSSESGVITRADVEAHLRFHPSPSALSMAPSYARMTDAVSEAEKRVLEHALSRCRSTREMAAMLGVSQSTIVRRLRKYGLTRTPAGIQVTGGQP